MKIDDLMHSSGAIPLPFISLNKVLPGQCLSGERNEVSQVDKTRIKEVSVSKVMHYTGTAVSGDGNISHVQMLYLIGDSGCVEGFSTTRGDESSSEASSTSLDMDKTNEQPHSTDGYVLYYDVTDKHESLPDSLEESTIPNKGDSKLVISPANDQRRRVHYLQPPDIPPVDSVQAVASKKQKGAGKSKTKQQKPSESVVQPNQETACHCMGACNCAVLPPQPQVSSSESEDTQAEEAAVAEEPNDLPNGGLNGSDGTKSCSWAEATREDFHISASPYQSGQDQSDSTGAIAISVGEPPPEDQVTQDEHHVALFPADPGPFPGGGIVYIQQMVVMEPQPPLQPEPWHVHFPVQESEEGRNGPSQLVP